MMKNQKKFIAVFVFVAVCILSGILFTLDAEDTHGKLSISKTAISTSDENGKPNRGADVKLTVSANELLQPTTDIVFVFDVSGSMSYELNRVKKINTLKSSAKMMVNTLLSGETKDNIRIGIVSFGTTANKVQDFTNSINTLNSSIDGLSADGGTNVQHGLLIAKNMLNQSNATYKKVILISDGQPTYFTTFYTDASGEQKSIIHGTGGSDNHETCDKPKYSGASYTNWTYTDNNKKRYRDCKEVDGTIVYRDNYKHNGRIWESTGYTYPNGEPKKPSEAALEEASEIKNFAQIYSIGFGSSANDIADFLKSIATSNNYSFSATSNEALNTAMNEIAGSIKSIVATNAVIRDVVPSGFVLDEESINNLKTQFGENNVNIETNDNGETTITINVGDINVLEPIEINYHVNAHEDYYGAMYTNKEAQLSAIASEDNHYYDFNDGVIELTFDKPVVAISKVTNNDDYTVSDTYTVMEGNTLNVNSDNGILKNDSETILKDTPVINGNPVNNETTINDEIIITRDVSCGVLKTNNDGSFTYKANEGCAGEQSFDYYVKSTIVINGSEYVVTSNTSTVKIKVEKNPTTYTVKYLDRNTNNSIFDDKTENGYVFDSVTENYKPHNKYNLDSNATQTIKLKANSNENIIIFYYTKKNPVVNDPTISKTNNISVIESTKTNVPYKIIFEGSIKDYEGSASIVIVDTLPYEINERESELDGGQYNSSDNTITWNININDINTFDSENSGVIRIEKNISIKYNYPSDAVIENVVNNVNGTISVSNINKNASGTHSDVFNVNGTLVVNHYYSSDTPVTSSTTKPVGTRYTTSKVDRAGFVLDENRLPNNAEGNYIDGTITVNYYYNRVPAEITNQSIDKTSETVITSSNQEVTYNILYSVNVNDYDGDVVVTIVDTLPYHIDVNKSNLNKGVYNPDNKTITWVFTRTINTFNNVAGNINPGLIEIPIKYSVVYTDLDASVNKITNRVVGHVDVETAQSPSDVSDSVENSVNINGSVTVYYKNESNQNIAPSSAPVTGKVGTSYETSAINISGYELKTTPDNANGEYIEGNIDVIYIYKRKGATSENPVIEKTYQNPITSSNQINNYTIKYSAVVKDYVGDITVTLVDTLPYEIDTTKSYNVSDGIYNPDNKTITWVFNYNVESGKELRINIEKNISFAYKNIDNTLETIRNTATAVLSDTISTNEDVESETYVDTPVNINGKIIVKYLEKDTNRALSSSEEYTGKVGTSKTVNAKDITGYNLYTTPSSESIVYIEGNAITKIFYYTMKEAKFSNESITKTTRTKEILSQNQVVDYQISYYNTISDLNGSAIIKIVDTIPYEINERESDLNGGTYNKDNKTITWNIEVSGINTYENGNYQVNIVKNIRLKYLNIPSNTTITNSVNGHVETTLSNSDGVSDTSSVDSNIKGIVKVNHIYRDSLNNESVLDNENDKVGYVGENYTTSKREYPGLELISMPINYSGKYTEETIIVNYYYKRVSAIVDSEISKTSTLENTGITSSNQVVNYQVNYNVNIDKYIGKATIKVVDTLPYYIDINKSNLNNGVYNPDNKTITWTINKDINTYGNNTTSTKEVINGSINYSVVYLDIDLTSDTLINKVDSTVSVETAIDDLNEDESIVPINVNGTLTVKYVDEGNNNIISPIESEGKVGSDYTTEEKTFNNYTFLRVDGDKTGKYIDGNINVVYVYRADATTNSSITKTSNNLNNVVNNVNDKFEYTIKYNSVIEDYIGPVNVVIVDKLSHAINERESKLNNGIYDSKNLTITWEYSENINTYENGNKELELVYNLELVYLDLDPKVREVKNSVSATINTETSEDENDNDEVITELNVYGSVTVKYVDILGNVLFEEEKLSGLVGQSYQTVYKESEEYQLNKVIGSENGEYIDGNLEVIYVYEKAGMGGEIPPQTSVDSKDGIISMISLVFIGMLLILKRKFDM